jgi:hypothetical protein
VGKTRKDKTNKYHLWVAYGNIPDWYRIFEAPLQKYVIRVGKNEYDRAKTQKRETRQREI